MINILFVCLGNICRSPAAEALFKDFVREKGRDREFFIDSAGTSGAHDGELADVRMRKHAAMRGYALESRSRQFLSSDFSKFDWIVVMDPSNKKNVLSLANSSQDEAKVLEMADFSPSFSHGKVPDPYYGGDQGFEEVLDILEEGRKNLLSYIDSKK